MFSILVLSFPLAFVWMILTDQLSLWGLVIGYGISVLILRIVRADRFQLNIVNLPQQLFWAIWYIVRLAVDISVSSVQVAWVLLSVPIWKEMPRDLDGKLKVATKDKTKNPLISALSAYSITITPGELVAEFEEGEDTIMYVHCLNQASSRQTLEKDQADRLQILYRVLGYDK